MIIAFVVGCLLALFGAYVLVGIVLELAVNKNPLKPKLPITPQQAAKKHIELVKEDSKGILEGLLSYLDGNHHEGKIHNVYQIPWAGHSSWKVPPTSGNYKPRTDEVIQGLEVLGWTVKHMNYGDTGVFVISDRELSEEEAIKARND